MFRAISLMLRNHLSNIVLKEGKPHACDMTSEYGNMSVKASQPQGTMLFLIRYILYTLAVCPVQYVQPLSHIMLVAVVHCKSTIRKIDPNVLFAFEIKIQFSMPMVGRVLTFLDSSSDHLLISLKLSERNCEH